MTEFTAKLEELTSWGTFLGRKTWEFRIYRDGKDFDAYTNDGFRTNQRVWTATRERAIAKANRQLEKARAGKLTAPSTKGEKIKLS